MMNKISTANIMLIALLVIGVVAMTVLLFSKTAIPTAAGDMSLKKSLFGMTIHSGKMPAVSTTKPDDKVA